VKTTVMMIEDHPLVRKGLEAVIGLEEDLEMIGGAANGTEALRLIGEYRPDVALVDLRLPGEHGLDIIKNARKVSGSTRYIVLTSYSTEEEIHRAMKIAVEGYILKEALPEELIAAIRSVSRGKNYYDSAVVQYAMGQVRNDSSSGLEKLTPRELEVLRALGRGLSNRSIADELYISEHTVKKHVGRILEKLCLHDRTQAALLAVSRGLHDQVY
jgi:DNA-binding NarL/FixJ family response regulator